jgi:diacylglycerol kinase (ATP)
MKPGKTGINRVISAAGYSMQGIKAAWINEAAIRQEISAAILLTLVAIFLPVTPIERTLLIASLLIVVIVELLNSAVEAAVDRIGSELHELSGRAKDIGSAAVFVALLLVALVWITIIVDIFI